MVAIFPRRLNLLIGPNALPLLLGTVALAFFNWAAQISPHLLLRRRKEERQRNSSLCSVAALFFRLRDFREELGNIAVSCELSVKSSKDF